jgi:hypothetical protein
MIDQTPVVRLLRRRMRVHHPAFRIALAKPRRLFF